MSDTYKMQRRYRTKSKNSNAPAGIQKLTPDQWSGVRPSESLEEYKAGVRYGQQRNMRANMKIRNRKDTRRAEKDATRRELNED